jgi:hypothetical protein
MTSTVTLDGFPLTGTTDRGGRIRVTSDMSWYAKSLNRNRQPKAQQDGSWPSMGSSNSPVHTIAGIAVYTNAASAKADARQMLTLCGRGSTAELTVTDDLLIGTRFVELDDVAVVPVRDTMLSFTFVVTAPDPLLYGPAVFGSTTLASSAGGTGRVWPRVWPTDWGVPPGVTPGAIVVANGGTASYFPRLRVNGPVTNPVITLVETGDVVRFNGFVAAGQHLDINWGVPRRVTIGDNPVSVRQKVTSIGNFLAVPVGGGNLSYSADDANPAATLDVWSYEGAWE